VVGEFVKLKKRGTNYIGVCPFHNEKSPSFTVSPAKEIYKCFGCGKSGNTITFLMEHEKYNYVEAITLAGCARYNIEVEETETSPNKSSRYKLPKVYTSSTVLQVNFLLIIYLIRMMERRSPSPI
jgi:DNA primase